MCAWRIHKTKGSISGEADQSTNLTNRRVRFSSVRTVKMSRAATAPKQLVRVAVAFRNLGTNNGRFYDFGCVPDFYPFRHDLPIDDRVAA
jgi:hypothetical protein